MYKFLSKHSTSVAFGLGVLVSAIGLIAIFSGLDSFNALAKEDQSTTTIFNAALGGAMLLIVVAAVAMIGFAGAAVLYDTSNVLHHYSADRHVAAALQLFASIAMMFWYVLRLFMSRD